MAVPEEVPGMGRTCFRLCAVSSARDVTQTHIAGRPACDQDSQGRAGPGASVALVSGVYI